MKTFFLACCALLLAGSLSAQHTHAYEVGPDGYIRCGFEPMDKALRAEHPALGSDADFENWLAPLAEAYKRNPNSQRTVRSIPIIFHVIHNGTAVGSGSNIAATYVNAQIEQLNNDFRRILGTSGYNTNPVGADTEVEFCAALYDPSGNLLAEPGINRISRSTRGWSAPPYSDTYTQNTIKPQSQWDPTAYLNVWCLDLSGGLLGYAQFPSQSGLQGLNNNGGAASTDGVVVLYSSVGSSTTPFPGGAPYNLGRTLTHEVGHWVGLRHIWGDGGCGVDDFCADTPASDAANYGCPTGHVSCGSVDMIENYMDYTNDACMNIFTLDQKARIQAVLDNSPRRNFSASTACTGLPPNPCADVVNITCGQTYQGSMASADNTWSTYGCTSTSLPSVDAIHSFTLTESTQVSISGMTNGYAYFLLSDCDPAACVGADSDASGSITGTLAAGTYYVAVEKYSASSNTYAFSLNCALTPPPTPCGSAIAVACGQTYQGSMAGADDTWDDYNCSSFDEPYSDAIHSITVAESGDLSIGNMTNGYWYYLLASCDPMDCLGHNGTISDGGTGSITATVSPGTYYVVVEKYAASSNSYTFSVNCPSAPPAVCENPTAFTIVPQSPTSVYVDWEDKAGASSYLFIFRKAGPNAFQKSNVTKSNILLEGLDEASSYVFRVRTKCGPGDVAGSDPLASFSTPSSTGPCGVPSIGVVDSVSPVRVRVFWSYVPGATQYQLRYRTAGIGTYSFRTSTEANVFVNSLTPGQLYECQVRAMCNGAYTDWSGIEEFMLANSTLRQPTASSADFELYPNPTSATLYLSFGDSFMAEQILLSDLSGRQLHSEAVQGRQHELQVGHLPAGFYIVVAIAPDGQRVAKRFVKQ